MKFSDNFAFYPSHETGVRDMRHLLSYNVKRKKTDTEGDVHGRPFETNIRYVHKHDKLITCQEL